MANEKRYNPARPSEGYDRGDLAALKVSSLTPTMVCAELRFDSVEDASIFFARQLDYIKAKSYDKVYPEFTALNHFPITHEVPEGAESMTYYSYDKTGFAAIISGPAPCGCKGKSDDGTREIHRSVLRLFGAGDACKPDGRKESGCPEGECSQICMRPDRQHDCLCRRSKT